MVSHNNVGIKLAVWAEALRSLVPEARLAGVSFAKAHDTLNIIPSFTSARLDDASMERLEQDRHVSKTCA